MQPSTLRALDLGNIRLVDSLASTNTVAFYANLMKLADGPGFAFGQQGAADGGIGWSGTAPYTRSDVYDVIAGLNGGVGDYPAVDGYNVEWALLHTIIPGTNNPKPGFPGEPLFSVTLKTPDAQQVSGEVQAAYARGEIITFHFPFNNPDAEVGGDSGTLTNAHPERGSLVRRCLPAGYAGNTTNGDLYPVLQGGLDSFAQLIQGDAGLGLANLEQIPILARPWHEWNFGKTFWWGTNECSTAEFMAVWQFTVNYLRDVKGLHNLVYVWGPSLNVAGGLGDAAAGEANYFSRWPGDGYVDVLGGDCYYSVTNGYYSNLVEMLPVVLTNAVKKNKVPALSEIGPKQGILNSATNRFWMNSFLRPLLRDLGTNAARVAYALTWASSGKTNHPFYFSTWPEPGQTEQEAEFFDFWSDPLTLFQGNLPNVYAGSSFSFLPTDDAFVYANTADTNYGGTTLLKVRTNLYLSYLKFNVTGIPAGKTVAGVRLKLYSQNVDQNVTVCRVSDTNWTEGALTWNNQPGLGAALATVRVYTNSLAVFNLPGAVAGNGWVAFGLQGSSNVMHQFASKETGTVTNRPTLDLVVVDAPSSNQWPRFRTNTLAKAHAAVGLPYNDTLAGDATDPDAGDALTFDKILGPDWLSVSSSGVLSGTPPGTNLFVATVRVRDSSGAFDIAQVNIQVDLVPANTAPTLAAISNRVVSAGQTVTITNVATDPDVPATQTLAFSLLSNPAGAALDAVSGVLTWRPALAQANTTNLFRVAVADNGTPSLSATQAFFVTVNPLSPATLTNAVWLTNRQFRFTLAGPPGPDFALQASTNLSTWTNVLVTNSPTLPLTWTDTNAPRLPRRFYRLQLGP